MKIGTLRAIAHNIADSLGSGCGTTNTVYDMNIYGEAKNPRGVITMTSWPAKVIEGKVSAADPRICDREVSVGPPQHLRQARRVH